MSTACCVLELVNDMTPTPPLAPDQLRLPPQTLDTSTPLAITRQLASANANAPHLRQSEAPLSPDFARSDQPLFLLALRFGHGGSA